MRSCLHCTSGYMDKNELDLKLKIVKKVPDNKQNEGI